MPLFAVTAVGADRPGIVAAVTGALVAHGGNLEDTSMSILRGHFAMVMIVAAPDELDDIALEMALTSATAELGLVVSVRRVNDSHGESAIAEGWTVVVYGADHPGIVHGVTQHLADAGVNVVDLTTRVTDADPPIYAMVMEVTLPEGADPEGLLTGLEDVAATLGVTCTLHPSEADILQVAVRPVLHLPATVLQQRASEVATFDGELRALVTDLVDTMRASPACVGLAANQIGVARRVFVVDVTGHPKARSCAGEIVLVNPEIVEASDPVSAREGCMSVPDLTGDVARASRIVMQGASPDGVAMRIEADAFEARALLHELDHLDGRVFLDRVASSTSVFRRRVYR